ncbi:hypothetical protein JCM10212_005540 [Sporobolomyces blumeae]
MSSLKSLMQAKKQSSRISHPHAKYSSNSLHCSLCQIPIKSDALWGSHLVSKQHRVKVQHLELEQQRLHDAQAAKGKRRQDEPSDDDDDNDNGEENEAREPASKRLRADADADGQNGVPNDLPSGFFSNASTSTSTSNADATTTTTTDRRAQPDGPPREDDDPELDAFLSSLGTDPALTADRTASSATISAQPVKFEFGAPKVRRAGAGDDDDDEGEGDGQGDEDEDKGETEEERREREEREEREEMMQRLEEEEREQREADGKVAALKRRLEAIRQAKQKKQASS